MLLNMGTGHVRQLQATEPYPLRKTNMWPQIPSPLNEFHTTRMQLKKTIRKVPSGSPRELLFFAARLTLLATEHNAFKNKLTGYMCNVMTSTHYPSHGEVSRVLVKKTYLYAASSHSRTEIIAYASEVCLIFLSDDLQYHFPRLLHGERSYS